MGKNDTAAIILIHGFTGSPRQMQWLDEKFEQDGFAVITPTLKGHGTKPEDLFECTYQDWIAQTEQALFEAQRKYESVFVAGLSMGGTLALRLAANIRFAGLIALSAPIRLPLADEFGVRYLHWLVRWRHKETPSDIKDKTALKLLDSYHRYPTKSAAELFKLLQEVRPQIPNITLPTLIIHGEADHTVPVANAAEIYRTISSREKKLVLLKNSYHIVTMDFDKQQVLNEMRAFASRVLEKGVIALSK